MRAPVSSLILISSLYCLLLSLIVSYCLLLSLIVSYCLGPNSLQISAEEDGSERADVGASRQPRRTVAALARTAQAAPAAQAGLQRGIESRSDLRLPSVPQVHGRHTVSQGAIGQRIDRPDIRRAAETRNTFAYFFFLFHFHFHLEGHYVGTVALTQL